MNQLYEAYFLFALSTECIDKDTNSDGVFHIITSEDTSIEKEQPEREKQLLPISTTISSPNTTDFNQTYEEEDEQNLTIFSTTSLENIHSNSQNCEVVISEFLDGTIWNSSLPVKPNVSEESIKDIDEEQVTWNFDLDEDKIPSVRVS